MKRPLKLASATLLCALAAACAPYDPAYEAEMARRQQDIRDHETCINYGTVPNTAAYDDCRRDLIAGRDFPAAAGRLYYYRDDDYRFWYDPYSYPGAHPYERYRDDPYYRRR